MSLILKAFNFAQKKHEGQKYGHLPYFDRHVVQVYGILTKLLPGEEGVLSAALLHDTLEDTETTMEELQEDFGDEVAQIVDLVTTSASRKKSRKQKIRSWELKFLSAKSVRLPSHVQSARFVKMADRLANVLSCWETRDSRLFMYRDEHATFEQTVLKWATPDQKLESLSLQICELLDVPTFSMSAWLEGRPW